MTTDEILKLILEKQDALEQGQGDIRERVTRIEGKFNTFEANQEHHYQQNQREHSDLVALCQNNLVELTRKIKNNVTAIERVKKAIASMKKILNQRKGERRILGRGWELLIAFTAGGGTIAALGLIAKLLKMF